ncbi:Histidine kinase [Abeliophyllum distichum]|uniref:Histidine kinase n=1 Tax=Abeliophyllum distichum TaxID=126358 RepID=A0ABD1PZP4_9LAMI
MYGQHPLLRPCGGGDGGGRGVVPPPQHLNYNLLSNPNLFHLQQNPNFLPHLNPFLQNPSNFPFQQNPSNFPPIPQIPGNRFAIPQIPNTYFPAIQPNNNNSNNNKFPQQQHPHGKLQNEAIEKVDRAVVKARRDLLASKENVSAWTVSQAALLMVKADSWESLGFQIQQVPSLHSLLVTEGKINAFIHCFVAVRRITSLYDLEVAICKNEGVEHFEQLELGPLVRHPLAMHYFSVSSDVAEVHRITSEEIISYLFEFMDTQKRKLKVDVFLDFIAKKQSVSNREKLCVRIQNLGTYATLIHQARQSEDRALEKCLEKIKNKSAKGGRKRPLFSAQKKQLDDHFEDGDSEDNGCEDNQDENNTPSNCTTLLPNLRADRVSSCPYPSAAEEMTRLGLKSEVDGSPCAPSDGVRCSADVESSQRKRKSENIIFKASSPQKLIKREKFHTDIERKGFSNQGTNDHLLANDSLRMFITTWKEACRGNSVDEVLERMLQLYNTRKKKKVKELFTSYPWVGLLNVAVTSMKFGMWDSMYDTFQAFSQQDVAGNNSENSADCISIDVEQAEKDVSTSGQKILKHEQGVIVEDIVKKLSGYFDDDITSYLNPSREKKFLFLRKLSECESWLIKQYSVKKFEALGYGEYYMFLEKHMHLLSHALRKCLIGDTNENDLLEARLKPLHLEVLLSQASNSLWENETVSLQNVSELLTRQFPLVCLELVKSDLMVNFGHSAQVNEDNLTSKCLLFSAPLLRPRCNREPLPQNEKKMQETSGSETYVPKEGSFGTVRTKDAIEVLLRAPMLADLNLWSHWDLVFAPSLGPIMEWLLNEVNAKELLCLATKDGKIIRVDHSSTIDSYLKVFIEGSSFETAVKLLSLYVLYGGEQHVPLSLLKCHARQAFEVMINNLMEMELQEDQNPFVHKKPSHSQRTVGKSTSGNLTNNLHKNTRAINKVIPVASTFILDCLSYLPLEFCSFAADVLLAGLQYFVKDASSAILTACNQIEQRLMLHEVGISLGIVEWANDYHSFRSSVAAETLSSRSSFSSFPNSESNTGAKIMQDILNQVPSSLGETMDSNVVDRHDGYTKLVSCTADSAEGTFDDFAVNPGQRFCVHDNHIDYDPAGVIESIRREEFGLDQNLSVDENRMLEKQHARLGRALHCLSQELYSQDSHFLLELVQNADDNIYQENVEPTLTFILLETGIIVLNNEQGFSAKNIRALCDVGNSTKKGQNAGYIGKKGIGFKSVFRVTDAPEIHSNGFHLKFDITEGQIGFVLPTLVPPCNIDLYTRLASADTDQLNRNSWNTCIVLPFRSNLSEGLSVNNIVSMFSDLHPSLLLFLHRLQCIKFRNILDDSLIVMRKEVVGDGIVKVSFGNEKMTWFVVSQELQAHVIRPDVQTTEISIAFTLQETADGELVPILNQQPVFAFLPLRTYGLKFILQGDFILPSSREEVDGNSPWNQWLLSEFPGLFVGAERSFCDLPCFRGSPGKAVAAFLSFIPLVGEVHGFFSSLPRMILSKLRLSNCLLLEGDEKEWVPPCKVLRNWTDQARSLLPDSLLREHLGLGYLNKDIVLSDTLAVALGVDDYGPKIVLQVIISLCCSKNGLNSMDISWLTSCLSAIYVMSSHSSGQTPSSRRPGLDITYELRKTPFIPLSDGKYGSVEEGTIWLHSDVVGLGINDESVFKVFPKLYDRLRIVSPDLFSAAASVENSSSDASIVENVTRLLYRVGVQRLSDHEIVKVHIPTSCLW